MDELPQEDQKCLERTILTERYRADLRVYVDATNLLDELTTQEFEKAYEHAQRARLSFERAREALNHHISQHGCER
jgi:hypothetical protein